MNKLASLIGLFWSTKERKSMASVQLASVAIGDQICTIYEIASDSPPNPAPRWEVHFLYLPKRYGNHIDAQSYDDALGFLSAWIVWNLGESPDAFTDELRAAIDKEFMP